MLKISTKTTYGMAAVLHLAVMENIPQSIKQISEKTGVSDKYLEQIFVFLKKSKIVKSIRGARGGYVLAGSPENISAGDILRALESNLTPVSCIPFSKNFIECKRSKFCITQIFWSKLTNTLYQTLNNITLKDLACQYNTWLYEQSYMLNI